MACLSLIALDRGNDPSFPILVSLLLFFHLPFFPHAFSLLALISYCCFFCLPFAIAFSSYSFFPIFPLPFFPTTLGLNQLASYYDRLHSVKHVLHHIHSNRHSLTDHSHTIEKSTEHSIAVNLLALHTGSRSDYMI
jgi:hypothetical protein